jgi:hypothetical protein
VLLIRRRRPVGEAVTVEDGPAGGGDLVVAPLGASRIAEVLREFGRVLGPAADPPVTQWLPDLDAGIETLAARDLGQRFAVVALASHLVNTPDPGLRAALLAAAARHLGPGGRLLVEHHPLDWLETAAESWSGQDGARLGMVDIVIDRPFVAAVSVYEAGASVVRQPFRARVLGDAELDAELAAAGLRRVRRLGPTWLEAESAAKSLE